MEANEFNRLVEQYMLMDKKTLAELLALKELAGRLDVPVVPNYPPAPQPIPVNPYYPWYPGIGDYPWWPQVWYTTKTTDGHEYENYTPNTQCELNRHDVIHQTLSSDNCAQHIRTKKEQEDIMNRFKNFN